MVQDKIYSYFDSSPELRLLFIFDGLGSLLAELEDLRWREGFRFEVFDGGWFSTKYRLTHDWKDDKVILLFQGMSAPSPSDEFSVFPLYGEMKSGMVYSEEDYLTFMQLRGIKEDFASFISKHIGELQLSKFDKLLSYSYAPGVFSTDIVLRALLCGYMDLPRLLGWEDILVRLVCLCAEGGAKLERFIRSLKNDADALDALSRNMVSIAGQGFDIRTGGRMQKFAESFKYNSIVQGIPPVHADDYCHLRVDDALVLQRLNSFREHALSDSQWAEKFSKSIDLLAEAVREENIIRWYGPDAEYFFVTESLCTPVIQSLLEKSAFVDPVGTGEKLRALSLRLPREGDVQRAVDFALEGCRMLEKLQAIGPFKLKTPEEYIKKYVEEFSLVDSAYRHCAGAFTEIEVESPFYAAAQPFKQRIDAEYAKQCNLFNLEWMKCLRESGTALISMDGILHQADFYDVKLKGINMKRVVIVSDALRYEVAAEILSELGSSKHEASLDPALASLPTETKYTKSLLLPHSSLQYADCTLKVDGEALDTTPKRSAHLRRYESGALCIDSSELGNLSLEQRRELFKSPLVYIFHDTIDSLSHGNPSRTPKACADAVEELKKLIVSLHSSYNVANVYLTSDHGFLFNDIDFSEKDKHRISDSFDERKTRYYITSETSPVLDIEKFQFSEVSAMSAEGKMIAVPEGSNRLYAEGGGYVFAHGGASLQELIIPVLYSHIRKDGAKPKVDVMLLKSALNIVSSRLKFDIVQTEAVSEDTRERTIICGVYEGSELLSPEKSLKLDSRDVNPRNRLTTVELTLSRPSSGGLLELRIYDEEDRLNSLAKATVKDNTLIERDF